MKCTIEFTLYPLQDDYIDIMDEFTKHLHSYKNLLIETFPTATVLYGDYDTVMACMKEAIAWSTEHQGKSVFITKILPNYGPQG